MVLHAYADEATELTIELRLSRNEYNYTPEHILEQQIFSLLPGRNCVQIDFAALMPYNGYAYVCLKKNERVKVSRSLNRITGILSLFNGINAAVSNFGKQQPS